MRRSKRGGIPGRRYEIEGESFMCASLDIDELATYEEAVTSPNANEWITAMKEEINSMAKNNVWELVDLPAGLKTIGNKWVLKVKHKGDGSIDKFKARLVAKGYTQRESIDYEETFYPVVKFASVRLILAIIAHLDLELFQMDVKTAFLNGELDEEIYMDQPEGNNMQMIVATQKWLSSTFQMKDMGEAEYILGVKIHRDHSKKLLSLSQEAYIKRIIERLRSLMNDMMGTRPDLCFVVGMVSSYQSNPRPDHWVAVKKILKYLKGTSDLALCYHGGSLSLVGYSDADGSMNRDERKSTSGYTFLLGGAAITWWSKKQRCISLSTMEAEYVACT
ncbi:UNVERIFIED_CONTAM: Retrovirus-related Pol polyprotein from transposon TNT 1-94 [Sesamum radiatum]|uniref:Retrovirus-related Pol polyprotein from transposon TNT 1-94 n=1 Tax=Sesamum radiatum TaxID=300843 RepID=A0AAW2U8I9_SESRA